MELKAVKGYEALLRFYRTTLCVPLTKYIGTFRAHYTGSWGVILKKNKTVFVNHAFHVTCNQMPTHFILC